MMNDSKQKNNWIALDDRQSNTFGRDLQIDCATSLREPNRVERSPVVVQGQISLFVVRFRFESIAESNDQSVGFKIRRLVRGQL